MQRAAVLLAGFLALAGGSLAIPTARGQSNPPDTAGSGYDDELAGAAADDAAASWESLVLPARYTPAAQLATSLSALFDGDSGVRISSDAEANLVLIRARSDRKEELLEVVRSLDRRPAVADVQAILLEAPRALNNPASLSGPLAEVSRAIEKLESEGLARVARHFRLTALENERAMVQTGRRVPVVSGTALSRSVGRPVRSYREENVGTILSISLRCPELDRLLVDIQFELSELTDRPDAAAPKAADNGEVESAAGPPAGEPSDASITPPDLATITYQATLELASGSAQLVQHAIRRGASGSERATYLIFAATLREGTQPPVARALSRPVPAPAAPARTEGEPSVAVVPLIAPRALPPRADSLAPSDPRSSPAPDPSPRDNASTVDPQRLLAFARIYIQRRDDNGNGRLEKAEWEGVPEMNAGVDEDGDETITADEVAVWLERRFDASAPRQKEPVERSSLAEYTMRRFDADGSGSLEKSEWSAMRPAPAEADANRDDVISEEELSVWLRRTVGNRETP